MSEVAQNVAQATEVAAPSIGIVDLQNAVKIIDHACDQGAFKGWQVIEQVMAVRAKLAAFVDAAVAKTAEADAAAAAEAEAAEKAAKKPAAKKAPAKKTAKK